MADEEHVHPELKALQDRGYNIDGWSRWQQGGCGTYAVALTELHPHLRIGALGSEDRPAEHFFAHDDTHAYDSAGRHPLPYHGVHNDMDLMELDQDPEYWGLHDEGRPGDLEAAKEHAVRHGIGPMHKQAMPWRNPESEEHDVRHVREAGFAGYVSRSARAHEHEADKPDIVDDKLHGFRDDYGRDTPLWHQKATHGPVDLSQPVYAMQSHVSQHYVDRYGDDPGARTVFRHPESDYLGNDAPLFITHQGRLHCSEGTHRVAAALQDGQAAINGWHYDLDSHPVTPEQRAPGHGGPPNYGMAPGWEDRWGDGYGLPKESMGAAGPDYTDLSFASRRTTNNSNMLTAFHPEHGPVGELEYRINQEPFPHTQVLYMGVPEWHQRRGVGTALQHHLERRSWDRPIDHGARTDDGDSWAGSYGGGSSRWTLNGEPWEPSGQKAAAMDWRPDKRMFGPGHDTLDPRLFDENDQMHPSVANFIVKRLDDLWAPRYGTGWSSWARVYMAGSEATYWWGPQNNDFDTLIGVNYPALKRALPQFRQMSPQQIADHFNAEFRANLNDEQFAAPWDTEPWHLTYFNNPNSYDIRDIKPYAAYNILDREWVVRPPEAHADWSAAMFPHEDWRYVEDAVRTVQEILRLPEPRRCQRAREYWDYLHTDRTRAFGPYGTGYTDRANVVEKALDMHPDGLLTSLLDEVHEARKLLHRDALVRTVNVGDASTSLMVALVPPMEYIEKIVLEEGEQAETIHMTLAYLGSMSDYSEMEVDALPEVVQAWAESATQLQGNMSGVGTFANGDSHVLWVHPDIPGLPRWRESLVDHLEAHGYKVADDHGFTPHLSIAYSNWHFRFIPKVEPLQWNIHEVWACTGARWESFPLGR